jgi:hypothetical protein
MSVPAPPAKAFGCRGYTRQDAARIGLNVLLYSLNQ